MRVVLDIPEDFTVEKEQLIYTVTGMIDGKAFTKTAHVPESLIDDYRGDIKLAKRHRIVSCLYEVIHFIVKSLNI